MLCPRCGEEREDFAGNICVDCFLDREEPLVVPGGLSIGVCVSCGAVEVGGWRDEGLELGVDRLVREEAVVADDFDSYSLSTEVGEVGPETVEGRVFLQGVIGGRRIVLDEGFELGLERGVCKRCSRASGGYFEALIQVRSSGRELGRGELEEVLREASGLLEEVEASGGEKSFVSRVEEVKGGVDLYVGESRLAKRIAHSLKDRYGAETSQSATLVGESDGQQVHRVTYLVRLPGFREGDFVEFGGGIFLVGSVGERVSLFDVDSGTERREPAKNLRESGFERLGRCGDLESATVTMVRGGDLQVIDPASMQAVILRRPGFVDEGFQGEEVAVLSVGEDLVPVHPEVAERCGWSG